MDYGCWWVIFSYLLALSFSFSRRFINDLNFSGGGASVVYSDAIAAHGFSHELANYGEYSGAPTEGQTYEYAKTIREFSRIIDMIPTAQLTSRGS